MDGTYEATENIYKHKFCTDDTFTVRRIRRYRYSDSAAPVLHRQGFKTDRLDFRI
jgi:hypothetical protein